MFGNNVSNKVITDSHKYKDPADGARLFDSGGRNVQQLQLGKIVSDLRSDVEFHEVVNLLLHTNSLTITQSLYAPSMTMIIRVADTVGMFERIGTKGLQGEEFVKLKLLSEGRTDIKEGIELLFHVSHITDVEVSEGSVGGVFDMICITKEKIINDMGVVNQFFSGSESSIVENIFKNKIVGHQKYKFLKQAGPQVWSEREIFVDKSIGTEDVIVPGLQPFNAMQWLARRAYGGPSYPGSFFTFFETSKGYHFANIEKMIERNSKSGPYFTHEPMANEAVAMDAAFYRNIKRFDGFKLPSTGMRMNNGTFSHKVRKIDIVKKNHTDTSFRLDDGFNKFTNVGQEFNQSKEFFKHFGNEQPFEYLTTKDSTAENDHIEDIIGKKNAYQDLLSTFTTTIVVYGDSNLNVGDVILIDLPETAAGEDKADSIYSGDWFVSAVTHSIDAERMNTTLEITKSGLKKIHTNSPR